MRNNLQGNNKKRGLYKQGIFVAWWSLLNAGLTLVEVISCSQPASLLLLLIYYNYFYYYYYYDISSSVLPPLVLLFIICTTITTSTTTTYHVRQTERKTGKGEKESYTYFICSINLAYYRAFNFIFKTAGFADNWSSDVGTRDSGR